MMRLRVGHDGMKGLAMKGWGMVLGHEMEMIMMMMMMMGVVLK
jgi:hypothetical protein